ncbi:hypothetical protein DERF_006963 [Dermatophagoides farinae]|uniref:Secreted protein n=1 Tax=Dermatophagoides farinae TaxID=6954 RepID=A0A922L2L3_DERFA|nr:hypothetical protein DERF_006963 [Dermatophagoides farinae]
MIHSLLFHCLIVVVSCFRCFAVNLGILALVGPVVVAPVAPGVGDDPAEIAVPGGVIVFDGLFDESSIKQFADRLFPPAFAPRDRPPPEVVFAPPACFFLPVDCAATSLAACCFLTSREVSSFIF